jgi:hypothetical protein
MTEEAEDSQLDRLQHNIPSIYTPQHVLDIFESKATPSSNTKLTSNAPTRHLAALNLSIRIQGVVITDKLLWSVFILDPFTKNPVADSLGYGAEALSAYAAALLVEFNLEPTVTAVAQVCAATMSQLDVVRCAVLVPDETENLERRGRFRTFDRMVKIDLSEINDYFFINAWTEDNEMKAMVETLAQELSLKPSIKNNIEWAIFKGVVGHRQLFLDNFPHIQTGILRVVNQKRQEARVAGLGSK